MEDINYAIESFIDETKDNIEKLQNLLIDLETNSRNVELLNQIFRLFHTIKGTSLMLGYNHISELTHEIESVFDKIKSNKLVVNSEIITKSLQACDLILTLVTGNVNTRSDFVLLKQLIQDFKNLSLQNLIITKDAISNTDDYYNTCNNLTSFNDPSQKLTSEFSKDKEYQPDNFDLASNDLISTNNVNLSETVKKTSSEQQYVIYFEPNPNVFIYGNNLLGIFKEISSLGKTYIKPILKNIPTFDKLNPELCYLAWHIELITNAELNSIKDVFIFVESDSKIDITIKDEAGNKNLNNNKQYTIESKQINTETPQVNSIFQPSSLLLDSSNKNEIIHKESCINSELINSSDYLEAINVPDANNLQSFTADSKNESVHELDQKNANNQNLSVKQLYSLSHYNNKVNFYNFEDFFQSLSIQFSENIFSLEKINKLIQQVGELVTFQTQLNQISAIIKNSSLTNLVEELDRITSQIKDTTIKIKMLPIEPALKCLENFINSLNIELSNIQNIRSYKNVKLYVCANNLELDIDLYKVLVPVVFRLVKFIIDTYILSDNISKPEYNRNSYDIYISANQLATLFQFTIRCQNLLINNKKSEYLQKLLNFPNQNYKDFQNDLIINEQKLLEIVSELKKVKGNVNIISEANDLIFKIEAPLIQAIVDGLLIKVDITNLILPLVYVEECVEFDKSFLVNENLIKYRGSIIPIISLRDKLCISTQLPATKYMVITKLPNSRLALIVDQIIGEVQSVIKPISGINKISNVSSSAAILADGTIAFILDPTNLL